MAHAPQRNEAPIALPATGSPLGQVLVDANKCTLCLSCVSACPASALLDNPDRPQLRFTEKNCVQCGLCVKLDDARMGPAVQDLWMLLSGDRRQRTLQLSALLDGYEQLRSFDRRELALIEPLRTLRLIHYSAWLARRWSASKCVAIAA